MIWPQFEKRVKTGPVHDKAKLSKDGPPEIHEENKFRSYSETKDFEAIFEHDILNGTKRVHKSPTEVPKNITWNGSTTRSKNFGGFDVTSALKWMANAFSASLVPRICKFVSETLLEDSSSFKAMMSTSSTSSEGYFFILANKKSH